MAVKQQETQINSAIRDPEVRVVGKDGEQLGIMSSREANELADKEGLEFVGYDKNFIDTPAMFEIKTAEDCLKANELIDKLMYVYGMDKNPEQAEISLEDTVEANCGFGYRIRR